MRRRHASCFRFTRTPLCVLCILCVLCVVRVRADVTDYIGKTVTAVQLIVEGRETTDPSIAQVVENVAGRPLSMSQVRESITHLFSLGRFENVDVDASLDDGRVVLRYRLTPIHPVTKIRINGVNGAGIDAGMIRRAISDRYGTAPSAGRVSDMIRIVEDTLRERGYLHPTITTNVETQHSPDRATLVFTIDPGVRTHIGEVQVVGRPTIPLPEFVSRLGASKGAPYQRDLIAERIEKYLADRRSHGYYEARIVPVVQLADQDRIANLTLDVVPGPHVRVVFAGDALPADRRAELVPVEREGSVDEDLLEDSSNRIEDFLRAQGYRSAAAPHTREETNGELVITFTVKKGPQYRVAAYDISGNESLPREEFDAALKLREGQPFSDAKLDADVTMLEDLYRRRGFSSTAQSGVDPDAAAATPTQIPVVVHVVVREGPRSTVESVAFQGNTAITDEKLLQNLTLQPGTPYVPRQLVVDRDAILIAYQNLGYESANVDPVPQFSEDRTRVAIRFAIQEGPQIFIDHVLIVGNVRTRTETIERELRVKRGDPFSLGAINESQRRLASTGLFRRARIAELRHGDETTRDLLVTVEEAPPTTIGYGGGVEGKLRSFGSENHFDLAPRAFFDVGRRNLFGKNRSLNFFTSISLHTDKIPEYRLLGTFREPHLFDWNVDGFLTATVEQQIRSTFNFTRQGVSANAVRRLRPSISLTGNYQIQRTHVFDIINPDDRPLIDRLFPQFRLSSFSAAIIRDTRDDTVDPTSGSYVSATGQAAGKAIGSEVALVKSFLTAQAFQLVPRSNRLVFAGSARLGLATGFTNSGETGVQLPASERFFAGGDTTVRGFALDSLGVRHIPPHPLEDTLDPTGAPIGGNALVILNAELRAPVAGGLGVVGFLDTGNVFARTTTIDLGEFRSAVGSGVRYKSPFGPIRLDVGFKVNRQPGESLTAWFVSFGQAF
jgi:outer membrane protein insertion porin family